MKVKLIEITIPRNVLFGNEDSWKGREYEFIAEVISRYVVPLRKETKQIVATSHYMFHDGLDIRFCAKIGREDELVAFLMEKGYKPRTIRIDAGDDWLANLLTPVSEAIHEHPNMLNVTRANHFLFNQHGTSNAMESEISFRVALFYLSIAYERDTISTKTFLFFIRRWIKCVGFYLFWVTLVRLRVITKGYAERKLYDVRNMAGGFK